MHKYTMLYTSICVSVKILSTPNLPLFTLLNWDGSPLYFDIIPFLSTYEHTYNTCTHDMYVHQNMLKIHSYMLLEIKLRGAYWVVMTCLIPLKRPRLNLRRAGPPVRGMIPYYLLLSTQQNKKHSKTEAEHHLNCCNFITLVSIGPSQSRATRSISIPMHNLPSFRWRKKLLRKKLSFCLPAYTLPFCVPMNACILCILDR